MPGGDRTFRGDCLRGAAGHEGVEACCVRDACEPPASCFDRINASDLVASWDGFRVSSRIPQPTGFDIFVPFESFVASGWNVALPRSQQSASGALLTSVFLRFILQAPTM